MQERAYGMLVAAGKPWDIVYRDGRGDVTRRTVFVTEDGADHFWGHCKLREDRRKFAREGVLWAEPAAAAALAVTNGHAGKALIALHRACTTLGTVTAYGLGRESDALVRDAVDVYPMPEQLAPLDQSE